ncbi:MAG: hypothetical protein EAZ53_04975 [Bacteroidetes bacterium]|nr:MAG: hypothetical protein EAZ53_04975 [Bacteroidota bacterium]
MKLKKPLLIFCIFVSAIAQAQDTTAHFSIKLNPQHLLVRAFRLDFEYMFKKSIHGIVLAPSLYTGLYKTSSVVSASNNNEYVSDKISGWGVELFHKIYVLNIKDDFEMRHKVYLSYGINQQFIKAQIYDIGYYELQNADGINQIYYGQKDFIQNFDRKGAALQVGYESVIYNRIVFDLYLGIAYRHTKKESTELKVLNERYNEFSWEYGFSGLEPRIGLRLGIFIL